MPKKPVGKLAKILIWRYKYISNKQFIYILSAVVGLLSGLGAVILKNLTHFIQSLLGGKYIGEYHRLFYFIFPIIGFFLVALIIKYVIKQKIGHGIPSTLYAISKLKSILPPHQMWGSLITAPLTVGFGGSVGLEGPTVATGAALGSNVARFFHLNQTTRNLLVGAAAAGAMSSIFKAPIAGILFAIEIFSLDLTLASMVPLLIASIIAIFTSYFFLGEEILLRFPIESGAFNFYDVLFYVLLGVTSAAISIYFSKTYFGISNFFKKYSNPYKRLIIGGLLIGLLVYLVPPLFGEGYETINLVSKGNIEKVISANYFGILTDNSWLIIAFLVGLIALKVVAMSITFGAGGIGGVFAPTLFTGSITGFVFAYIMNTTNFFSHHLSTTNFALVGMAGLMAGILQAPLTAIFLIAEITNGYELFIPLMITASISFSIAHHYLPFNIYATELAQKGELLTHNKDENVMILMDIDKIIETNFIPVLPDMKLNKMLKNVVTKSTRNIFPIISENDDFMGIMLLDDIREIMFDKKTCKKFIVEDFLQNPPEIINYNIDSTQNVMEKFKTSGAWNLPVIKDGKYYGFISKSKLLTAYRRKLVEVTS